MQIAVSTDDPTRELIDTETAGEILRWEERLLRAGTEVKAYCEQKKVFREMMAWCETEPETRRQVVKQVVRNLRNRMDLLIHLQILLAERS